MHILIHKVLHTPGITCIKFSTHRCASRNHPSIHHAERTQGAQNGTQPPPELTSCRLGRTIACIWYDEHDK